MLIKAKKGFSNFSYLHGFNYIVSIKKEKISIWKTTDSLHFFFGELILRV